MYNSFHFESLDSTNTYLKDNYQRLDNFTYVSCDYQTNGKGRNTRNWKSESGKNLLFSLLILDQDIIANYKKVSIVSAYCLVKVLNKHGIKAMIKWPNDVYINDKKVAGILLESVSTSKIECLIVGIGLNVNQECFLGEYKVLPTSMMNESNNEFDLESLKKDIYNELYIILNSLNDHDYYHEIELLDYLKNKEVYAQVENERKLVKVIGIDSDYSLIVDLNNQIINIESDEITFHK